MGEGVGGRGRILAGVAGCSEGVAVCVCECVCCGKGVDEIGVGRGSESRV